MPTINANKKPLGATILCATTLWSLDNKNHVISYNRVVNQLIPTGGGNQLGAASYGLENVKRKALYELVSANDFSALLLYVGMPNYTVFGYKGSNQYGDGGIVLFYDINQKLIIEQYPPLPVKGSDNRFHFTGRFPIDSNVHFILFGGMSGNVNIDEVTLK